MSDSNETTVCRDFIEKLVSRFQVTSTYDISGVISIKAKEVTKHSDAHACQTAFGTAHTLEQLGRRLLFHRTA